MTMKLSNNLKRTGILTSIFCLVSVFSILFSAKVFGIESISDQMLLRALNNSIAESFPLRGELEEILEADVPYVLKLEASGQDISDVSGLEQFVFINSKIDLSNNNINDIAPLINWVRNKNNKDLSVDIFLGSNPVLSGDNYKQIYDLVELGENIRIYDSQREGEGVVELTGFLNGRPAEKMSFDQDNNPDNNQDNNQDINDQDDEAVNTGVTTIFIYILSCFIILVVLWKCIHKRAA